MAWMRGVLDCFESSLQGVVRALRIDCREVTSNEVRELFLVQLSELPCQKVMNDVVMFSIVALEMHQNI